MNAQRMLRGLAPVVAIASGLLVLMLAGLLACNEVRGKVSTLVNSREVVRLHDELRTRPKDEALKERIRQLDLDLRQETFYRLELSHTASRALIAALAAFLAGVHFVRLSRQSLPNPQAWGARKEEKRTMALARYAVAGVLAVVAGTALGFSTLAVSLPEPIPAGPSIAAQPVYPSEEEVGRQWASFRGPHGSGVAPGASVPVSWNAGTGKNILWKTAVPLHGSSSPVVWDNAVFLTGANETQSCVYRFDADTGALEWTAVVKLPGSARPATPQVGSDTGLAAPTPVTDGRRVYTIFPTGEIAAFDFSGKQVWARNIGPLDNAYGYASSLAIYRDRVLVQIDRGQAVDGQSRLVALDTQTGQPRWETKRDVAGSWASPVVIDVDSHGGQPQLITCAAPFVIAYDPVDGKELWRNKCLDSDVAPSPVMAANMIVAVAPNTSIVALHPGGTSLAWKSADGVPDATSPVTDGQRVYIVDSGGSLTCYNLQDGKVLWTHNLDEQFYASPTIAGKALILVSCKGTSWVIEPGDAYKELGKGSVGEMCYASPVPLGKRLLVRGLNNLFCIEAK
jgi:outer membrane protein assembly factor BamB